MKTNNPCLGEISCEACGDIAHIKRQRTGKQRLYLHCPNCGLDQRSGAKLQAKWQAVLDGDSVAEINGLSKTERPAGNLAIEANQSIDKTSLEWQPLSETKTIKTENSEAEHDNSSTETRTDSNEQESSGNGFGVGKLLAGLFGFAFVVARVRS